MIRSLTATPTLLVGVLMTNVVACAHSGSQPREVVRNFASAVGARDWQRAYAMMSATYRQRVPLAMFQTEMQGEWPTVVNDASILAQVSDRAVRAEVESAPGERIPLVLEGPDWKLDRHPLSPFGQETPRAALRTFVRALAARRYDIVLRLVPTRQRSRITIEALRLYWEGPGSDAHRRLLDSLRTYIDAPIIELGREAQMPYGQPPDSEGELLFLLEDGIWKIDDVG